MKQNIPYTYRIQCIPTGQYYYGVRYARKCDPTDLWVTYFTSSAEVKKLIKIHGKDNFKYEIRKVFNNNEDAIKWEIRVNSRTIKFSNYLNKTNGHRFSIESSIKGGEKTKGAIWWNNGQWNTKSHKSPGTEWVTGYIRNSTGKQLSPKRIKGVKLHWWNNGEKNILSAESPGHDWQSGMISGKRFWWNNGIEQIMSAEKPGPLWLPGFCQEIKDKLSVSAELRYSDK
jgi:hypothetical protein